MTTEVLEEYTNNYTKILCRCKIDGYERKVEPRNLLSNKGCPRCRKKEKYTTESFKERLKEINPNLEILGEYVNNKTKIKCRCLIDGYEYDAWTSQLLQGYGCPRCANRERYTTESFKEKLKAINPNIKIIDEYVNSYTKIKCKCLICGAEWETRPDVLLQGYGCPACNHRGTSWLQEELFNYFSQKYPSTLYRDKTLIGKELDIVIPELNIAIEPGSWYWHFIQQNKLFGDYQKQLLCKEKGYTCITLYDACDFPDILWYPALVYDKDIGQNKELLKDVIENIEDIIMEV